MIKPILKIELPKGTPIEDIDLVNTTIKELKISDEYHVIVINGGSEYINIEIITASDVSIHKP